jgi:O-glycosyl hydrolase
MIHMKNLFLKSTRLFFFLSFLATNVKAIQATDTVFTLHIDLNKTAQTIENFGASGCWFSEGIGKYWPVEKKETIARLLFSKQKDKQGNPEGIGLSAWRFNIGAGTTEQGDSGGIKDFRKRTECFLSPAGSYDWNKQAGYQFFLKKAHDYGVETLIAFSNSPPVQFTRNGLGYKTEKDHTSNLRVDAYDAYAQFLAQVIKHFDGEGIHFNYISPVNEPQWDWAHAYKDADQEGSPWKNEDIHKVVEKLNQALNKEQINSNILISEAGMLSFLYAGTEDHSSQIQHFFDPKSPLSVNKLNHVPATIAGHSYFTESNDKALLTTRSRLADTARKYKVNFWQSEYSMLADGYKEGAKGKISAINCALFLAKVIHTDLTTGNATAWQFWNSYEPGNADFDTRYYLIALNPKPDFKDGEFTATKNLWALGHYSLFIRPGMQRVVTNSPDNTTGQHDLLISAWKDKKNQLVIVGINHGTKDIRIRLTLKGDRIKYKTMVTYLTDGNQADNMKASPGKKFSPDVLLPARSISTLVLN